MSSCEREDFLFDEEAPAPGPGGANHIRDYVYKSLSTVLEDEGAKVTVKNCIIVIRAIEKILAVMYALVAAGSTDAQDYGDRISMAVDPLSDFEEKDVYSLVGQALSEIFDSAECSPENILEFEKGLRQWKCKLDNTIEDVCTRQGKALAVEEVTAALKQHEYDVGMEQYETAGSFADALEKAAKLHSDSLQQASSSLPAIPPGEKPRRGGNRTGHNTTPWTDIQRLEVLQLYASKSRPNHRQTAEEFNVLFPITPRTKHAVRLERDRLNQAGITIAMLQQKVNQAASLANTGDSNA